MGEVIFPQWSQVQDWAEAHHRYSQNKLPRAESLYRSLPLLPAQKCKELGLKGLPSIDDLLSKTEGRQIGHFPHLGHFDGRERRGLRSVCALDKEETVMDFRKTSIRTLKTKCSASWSKEGGERRRTQGRLGRFQRHAQMQSLQVPRRLPHWNWPSRRVRGKMLDAKTLKFCALSNSS